MTFDRIGYGAGTSDFSIPNVLRRGDRRTQAPVAGERPAADGLEHDRVVVLEANVDDMSPQHFELAFERVFAAGALDAWCTPIAMKKCAPGAAVRRHRQARGRRPLRAGDSAGDDDDGGAAPRTGARRLGTPDRPARNCRSAPCGSRWCALPATSARRSSTTMSPGSRARAGVPLPRLRVRSKGICHRDDRC